MSEEDEFTGKDLFYLECYFDSVASLEGRASDMYEKGICPFCGSHREGKKYCYSCVKHPSQARKITYRDGEEISRDEFDRWGDDGWDGGDEGDPWNEEDRGY